MSEPVADDPRPAEAASTEAGLIAVPIEPGGGDAACWANRVCPECGRLNEAERPEICEACGAEFG